MQQVSDISKTSTKLHNKLFRKKDGLYRHASSHIDGKRVLELVSTNYFDVSETAYIERTYELMDDPDYHQLDAVQLIENRPIINHQLEVQKLKQQAYIEKLYKMFNYIENNDLKLGIQIRIAFVETPTTSTLRKWNEWKKANPELLGRIWSMISNV